MAEAVFEDIKQSLVDNGKKADKANSVVKELTQAITGRNSDDIVNKLDEQADKNATIQQRQRATLAESFTKLKTGFVDGFRNTFDDYFGTPGDFRQFVKKLTDPVKNAVSSVGRGVQKGAETIFDVLKTGTLILGGIFAFKKFVRGFQDFEKLFGPGAALDQKIISGILNVAKGFLGLEDDTIKKLAASYDKFRNKIISIAKSFEDEGFLGGLKTLITDTLFGSVKAGLTTIALGAVFSSTIRSLVLAPFKLASMIATKSLAARSASMAAMTAGDVAAGAASGAVPTGTGKDKVRYNPTTKRFQSKTTGQFVKAANVSKLARAVAMAAVGPKMLASALIPVLLNPAFLGAIAVAGIGYTIYDKFLKEDLARIKEDGLFGDKLRKRQEEDKLKRDSNLNERYDFDRLQKDYNKKIDELYRSEKQRQVMKEDFAAARAAGNNEAIMAMSASAQIDNRQYSNTNFGGGGTKPGASDEYSN